MPISSMGAYRPQSPMWRDISSAPRDGTLVRIARDMGSPWGIVSGQGYFVDCAGIAGWVPTRGDSDIPGVLGLGHPSLWAPLSPPSKGEGGQ